MCLGARTTWRFWIVRSIENLCIYLIYLNENQWKTRFFSICLSWTPLLMICSTKLNGFTWTVFFSRTTYFPISDNWIAFSQCQEEKVFIDSFELLQSQMPHHLSIKHTPYGICRNVYKQHGQIVHRRRKASYRRQTNDNSEQRPTKLETLQRKMT